MKTFVTLLLFSMTLWTAQTWGSETLDQRIDSLVKNVDARYAQTKDLQADFIQETKIEGFETPLSSSGQVYIKKSGLLRWDYEKPSVEQIYVHGDELEMYVPEHNQVVKGHLSQLVATKAPLRLLQGAGNLAEQFEVTPTRGGELGEGGLPLLTLRPRQTQREQASAISQIVLDIQPTTYLIHSVSLYETSGNVSTFRFAELKVNSGLDDRLFELTVPDDVVVVDAPAFH